MTNVDYIGHKVQCHNCDHKFILQEKQHIEEGEIAESVNESTSQCQALADSAEMPLPTSASIPTITSINPTTIKEEQSAEKRQNQIKGTARLVNILAVINVIVIISVLCIYFLINRSSNKLSCLPSNKTEHIVLRTQEVHSCANTKTNLCDLNKMADAGDASAMNRLGFCYQNGIGVVKDETNAAALYRKGAALGDASAMTRLGFCYQNGIGVVKDETNAVALYRKAAELSNASAMTSLGFCYQNGIGDVKDETNAVAMYRKGAELGDTSAMNNLMYYPSISSNTVSGDNPLLVISSKKNNFKPIIFSDTTTNSTLTLISETECEIKNKQQILLAECSRQENKLRVVKREAGATTVIYFDILPEGIRDSISGKLYFLPEPLGKILEQAQIAQAVEQARKQAEQAAEQARKQAEQAEHDRQVAEFKSVLATNKNANIAPGIQSNVSAQVVSPETIKEDYQKRLAIAEKAKNNGIIALTDAYNGEVRSAQDDVRRKFAPLIRSAAIWDRSNEVSTLTFQMESIINPNNAIAAGQGSIQGSSFKQLVGKWESSEAEGSSKLFEFKSPQIVLITQVFTSTYGNSSNTEEWSATMKADKIVFESDTRFSSSSSKHWYEIALPFNADDLKITYHYEHTTHSSTRIYHLKRSLK